MNEYLNTCIPVDSALVKLCWVSFSLNEDLCAELSWFRMAVFPTQYILRCILLCA